jgi:hypothetical protein
LIRLLIRESGNLTTERLTTKEAIPPPQAIRDLTPRFSFGADRMQIDDPLRCDHVIKSIAL